MIQDILLNANPVFNFIEKIYDPIQYTRLTDNIIHEIEFSEDPALKKS